MAVSCLLSPSVTEHSLTFKNTVWVVPYYCNSYEKPSHDIQYEDLHDHCSLHPLHLSRSRPILNRPQLGPTFHKRYLSYLPLQYPQALIQPTETWCTSQTAECPLICTQTSANSATTDANSCDATTLTYSCVCGNGLSPNISQYSQTLPYFICTEWGNQCVTACGSDSSCASACRDDHPCGAQNPIRVNTSTISSTMMSKTSTGTPAGATVGASGTIYTGFGGAAATTSASSGDGSSQQSAAMALQMGQAYGLVVVAAGLFGGFALLL